MKSALIVWGGWAGHQPESSAHLFAGILREEGYEVELSDTLDAYLNTEKLQSLSLIVPTWTMGTIKPEQERGLLDAVRSRLRRSTDSESAPSPPSGPAPSSEPAPPPEAASTPQQGGD